jgi:hypothetical protein
MENHRGSYYIPPDAIDNFLRVYKFNLENDLPLGIVERPKDIMPLLVDLDFRQNVSTRLYNFDQIGKSIKRYDAIVRSLVKTEHEPLYFVLEKPSPRKHKIGLKDGVHIVCPSVVTRPQVQLLIRKMMLDNWDGMFEGCDFTNTKEDIYDESVLGTNGWFMYGSKKPDEEHPWTLSKVLNVTCDDDIAEVALNFSNNELVDMLSIRNKHVDNDILDYQKEVVKSFINEINIKKHVTETILNASENVSQNVHEDYEYAKLLFGVLSPQRANNFSSWIRVGWCGRNIDYRLLTEWIEFSKKSPKFVEGECEHLWNKMSYNPNGLKMGTLHKWAKEDGPQRYNEIVQTELRDLILNARSGTEWDVAKVFQRMNDKCVVYCSESKKWFRFSNHR